MVTLQDDMGRLKFGLAMQDDAHGLLARHLVLPVAVAGAGPVDALVTHDHPRQPHTSAPARMCQHSLHLLMWVMLGSGLHLTIAGTKPSEINHAQSIKSSVLLPSGYSVARVVHTCRCTRAAGSRGCRHVGRAPHCWCSAPRAQLRCQHPSD